MYHQEIRLGMFKPRKAPAISQMLAELARILLK